MKTKKILAALCAGVMLAATPAAPQILTQTVTSTAYAAKGGARIAAPKAVPSAPKAPAASSNSAPSKSVSGNGGSYAPSKSAKDLQKEAPSANSRTNGATANAAQQRSGSRFGNIMRTIGLFAGGMFLGSMLASLFGGMGMGTGLLADILGVLMNIAFLVIAVMAIRWLWNRFRGRKNDSGRTGGNPYRSANSFDAAREQPHIPVQDITPPSSGTDYHAKSMADRYRNR
jgi:hypothetical protein